MRGMNILLGLPYGKTKKHPVQDSFLCIENDPMFWYGFTTKKVDWIMATDTTKKVNKRIAPRKKKVTFGSVTVLVDVPTKAEVQKNIKDGQEALARLLKRIQTPGVKLEFKKGVPNYYADPENPSRLIRILNGKKERVVFSQEEGKFVVCK